MNKLSREEWGKRIKVEVEEGVAEEMMEQFGVDVDKEIQSALDKEYQIYLESDEDED